MISKRHVLCLHVEEYFYNSFMNLEIPIILLELDFKPLIISILKKSEIPYTAQL